jgi:hypothetical protein
MEDDWMIEIVTSRDSGMDRQHESANGVVLENIR